jgi:hypothetical protein
MHGSPRSGRPTRLNVRDLHAQRVYATMLAHADEIAEVRDVIQLAALRDLNGECIAAAVADLVERGRVVGASGAGAVRAVATEDRP